MVAITAPLLPHPARTRGLPRTLWAGVSVVDIAIEVAALTAFSVVVIGGFTPAALTSVLPACVGGAALLYLARWLLAREAWAQTPGAYHAPRPEARGYHTPIPSLMVSLAWYAAATFTGYALVYGGIANEEIARNALGAMGIVYAIVTAYSLIARPAFIPGMARWHAIAALIARTTPLSVGLSWITFGLASPTFGDWAVLAISFAVVALVIRSLLRRAKTDLV